MASDRQIAANRRNALLSTGPRTEAGKDNSRRNALDHGLRAEQLLLDGEDPVVFERLRGDLFGEFGPATAYEDQLVDRIVVLIWRLRRIPAFETALLNWIAYRQAVIHDAETAARPTSVLKAREYQGLAAANDQNTGAGRDQLGLGRLLAADMNKDLSFKLDRHEGHLMRQLKATRMELADHQKVRADREAEEAEISDRVLPVPAKTTGSTTIEAGDQDATPAEPVDA